MKKLLILAAALVLTGAVVAQTVPDAPSLKQARQRASYQVARIQNALTQDSIALYHAQRLYAMLDSMVVADSIASLPPPPADTLYLGWALTPTPQWSDLNFDSLALKVGQVKYSCVYGVAATGAFVWKDKDRCPNPSDVYPLPPPDHEVLLRIQRRIPDHVTAEDR